MRRSTRSRASGITSCVPGAPCRSAWRSLCARRSRKLGALMAMNRDLAMGKPAARNQNHHKYGARHDCRLVISGHRPARLGWRFALRLAAGFQREFCDHIVLVKPKEPRRGPHEAPAERAAGQLSPSAAFKSFQKSRIDLRCGSDFVERNSAHLPFALQMFAER
jgi:hypothetical protein